MCLGLSGGTRIPRPGRGTVKTAGDRVRYHFRQDRRGDISVCGAGGGRLGMPDGTAPPERQSRGA